MSLRAEEAAQGLRQRLPEPVKESLRRARRAVRAARPAGSPVLSVIVPSYNVREYIDECLESLISQTMSDLEVIVVDDGSTDGTWDRVRRFRAIDHRVRVMRQTNSGQGIARNRGVEMARGEFLTFIDADDTVPPKAFEYMIDTLRASGSDFCVGSAQRFSHGHYVPTAWATTVHKRDRIGVTIESFPLAMQDIIACNRVFRSDFWREKVGGFRGHIAYEDHVPMLTAYVRAAKFDVLSGTTYNWRVREDLTSTSQQKASIENLLDRVAVKEEAHALLVAEAPKSVYDTWVARTIEVDFPAFIPYATAGADLYRAILAATYRTFLDRAVPEAMAEVRYFQKSRAWLIAQERWDDLDAINEYFTRLGQLPPTVVEDGRILAEELPCLAGCPTEFRELSPLESRFDGAIERARWLDDGRLVIDGWAFIRSIDLPEPGALSAWLEPVEPGHAPQPLRLEPTPTAAATIWARNPNTNYDGGGFRLTVDPDALGEGRWRLRMAVEHGGLRRTGGLHRYVLGGGAVHAVARSSESAGRSVLTTPLRDPAHGFCIEVTVPDVAVVEAAVDRDHVAIGTLLTRSGTVPTSVSLTSGRRRVRAELQGTRDGLTRFRCEVPAAGTSSWTVAADVGDGPSPVAFALPDAEVQSGARLRWQRTWTGMAQLTTEARPPEASSLTIADDHLVVGVVLGDATAAQLRAAELSSPTVTVPVADVEIGADGTAELRFPLRTSLLGGPELPLPRATYDLRLPQPNAAGKQPLQMRAPLAQQMPLSLGDDRIQLRVIGPSEERTPVVQVVAPLRPDEQSLYGQQALQTAYRARTDEPAPSESVLFQCYRGEVATDSQRALDEALRLARPDLTRYWGVSDYSVEVPEGSVPVLFTSREWFEVLASARYLCNNIDFDGFFEKRPHQRYLQTFHGYPFKSMGRTFWEGKGFSPARIERELARRNAEYDAILVPSEAAAGYYRSEYDYTGRILVTGYPRSDFPVTADRSAVRAEVGRRLGIADDKRLVLYAPTYRDHLTTRVYAARRFDELDLQLLTKRLGDDVVILLRGHNNNQREADRVGDVPGVVDVTDYPEINHLTVAADAAILDYSSLRFDWALTGKPMVFFVPDLDTYFLRRPPLFEFRESAPGPLLGTTEEVADALGDLDALAARTAPEIARFNATYNELHDGHATERVIAAFFND